MALPKQAQSFGIDQIDLYQMESLCGDQKRAVHRRCPTNLTELQCFWREECQNIDVKMC